MTDFLVNVYPGYPIGKEEEYKTDEMTDQGQSDSVREVLTRFAREGVTPPDINRAAYADSFSDDVDIRGERVQNLLNTPDLSNMEEMEIVDFINANSEIKSVKDLTSNNKLEKNNSEFQEVKSFEPGIDSDPPEAE